MQVTRQAILRNTRSYKCLDTKSHWKWRRGLALYCISSILRREQRELREFIEEYECFRLIYA